jgi:hypothetical protein
MPFVEAEQMSFGWLREKHEVAVEVERARSLMRVAESPEDAAVPGADVDRLFDGKTVRRRL